MYQDVIGVVGGMGSYATLNYFRMLLEAFPAEKEWDRPRILIDNRCTMPSRVVAVLTGEKREQLVSELTESVRGLIRSGATKIVLACNTSHCFLDEIYENVPEAKKYVVHIIENCCSRIIENGVKKVGMIASEGTIQSGIYQKYLEKANVELIYPSEEVFDRQRFLIEKVKQNKITEQDVEKFVELIETFPCENVILGCTEFPVLYEYAKDRFPNKKIFDPLVVSIDVLKGTCK